MTARVSARREQTTLVRMLVVALVAAMFTAASWSPAWADPTAVNGTTTVTVANGATTTLSGLEVEGTGDVSVSVSTTVGTLAIPSDYRAGLTLAYGYTWSGETLSFYGPIANVNAALAQTTIAVGAGVAAGTDISIGLAARPAADSVTYNPINGHYYQYISDAGITWLAARPAALSQTYAGMQGYLVNITSAAENELVTSKIPSVMNVWIGATGTLTAPRIWTWADGPEGGQSFSRCTEEFYACDFISPVDLEYYNWAGSEPNNQTFENAAVTNWNSSTGLWNDLPDDFSFGTHGYVVEYGGTPGDTPTLPTVSSTVTVVSTPDAPSAVSAEADSWEEGETGSSSLTVEATEPDDNGKPITGYQWSFDGTTWSDAEITDLGATIEFQITGLTPGSTYTVQVRAVNEVGASAAGAAAAVRLPVQPTEASLCPPLLVVDTAATMTVSVDGYPAPTFSVKSGDLPDGMTLDEDSGEISGTPSDGGEYSFEIEATNVVGSVSVSVSGTVWTPPTEPQTTWSDIYVGDEVDVQLTSEGDPDPSFSISAGELPTGLVFENGHITGTPTESGEEYSFTVQAENTAEEQTVGSATATFTGTVGAHTTMITGELPTLVVGQNAGVSTFTADGFPAPTFAIVEGELPAGLVLDPDSGEISGTPTIGGAYEVIISAQNEDLSSASITLSGFVGTVPASMSALPSTITADSQVSWQIGVQQGDPAPTFETSDNLPTGLTLAADGRVTGIPRVAGTFEFEVTADNGYGAVSRTYTVEVTVTAAAAPTLVVVTPGHYQLNVEYAVPLATGGLPILDYEISIDGGLTWASDDGPITGLVAGTTYPVQVRVVTANGPGLASGTVSGVPTAPAAAAPDGFDVEPGTSSVRVSWEASTADGVTGYTVTAHPSGLQCSTYSVDDTSCVIGATAGMEQTFTIVVHSTWGDSDPVSGDESAAADTPVVPGDVPTVRELTLTTDQGDLKEVIRGQRFTVIGTGFAPGSTVLVVIYSTPQILAQGVAAADGSFRLPVVVPASLPVGEHTLVALGVDPVGETHVLAMEVEQPNYWLAATGASVGIPLMWSLSLVAMGAAMTLVRRRRREA